MKVRYLCAALLAFTFFGCDDNTNNLGLNMLPDSDQINPYAITFNVVTTNYQVDSVFAKTSTGYLGKYTDPQFGSLDADFLAQFNCTQDFVFPFDRMVPVDSTAAVKTYEALYSEVRFFYPSYFGDSLNACRMSVYKLNEGSVLTADKNLYYTNLDASQFYNPSNRLASKAYTAYDLSVSAETRKAAGYTPSVSIRLDKEIGNEIIAKNLALKDKKGFKDAEYFIKNIFPGVFAKSDYGDGTILYISDAMLSIYFKAYAVDSDGNRIKKKEVGYTDQDSTMTGRVDFVATKEVIQANQFKNALNPQILADKESTYLKSPAGIFTKATLPIGKIANALEKDTLNSIKLTLSGYNQAGGSKFPMEQPSNILLVREEKMKEFFETNSVNDNITSFIASRNAATNQYTFSNITRLITTCIAEEKAKNNGIIAEDLTVDVLLVPVDMKVEKVSNGNTRVLYIRHDLKPSYVKLVGGEARPDVIKLEVIYSSFYTGKK